MQKRGGSGIKTLKVTDKTGKIISMHITTAQDVHDVVLISRQGQTLRLKLGDISTLGRATQGVRVMKLDAGDKVASSTVLEGE